MSDFQITSRPPECLAASVLKTAFLKPGGHDPEDGGAPDGIAEEPDALVEELDEATELDDIEVDTDTEPVAVELEAPTEIDDDEVDAGAEIELELEFDGVVWFRKAPEPEAASLAAALGAGIGAGQGAATGVAILPAASIRSR